MPLLIGLMVIGILIWAVGKAGNAAIAKDRKADDFSALKHSGLRAWCNIAGLNDEKSLRTAKMGSIDREDKAFFLEQDIQDGIRFWNNGKWWKCSDEEHDKWIAKYDCGSAKIDDKVWGEEWLAKYMTGDFSSIKAPRTVEEYLVRLNRISEEIEIPPQVVTLFLASGAIDESDLELLEEKEIKTELNELNSWKYSVTGGTKVDQVLLNGLDEFSKPENRKFGMDVALIKKLYEKCVETGLTKPKKTPSVEESIKMSVDTYKVNRDKTLANRKSGKEEKNFGGLKIEYMTDDEIAWWMVERIKPERTNLKGITYA